MVDMQYSPRQAVAGKRRGGPRSKPASPSLTRRPSSSRSGGAAADHAVSRDAAEFSADPASATAASPRSRSSRQSTRGADRWEDSAIAELGVHAPESLCRQHSTASQQRMHVCHIFAFPQTCRENRMAPASEGPYLNGRGLRLGAVTAAPHRLSADTACIRAATMLGSHEAPSPLSSLQAFQTCCTELCND